MIAQVAMVSSIDHGVHDDQLSSVFGGMEPEDERKMLTPLASRFFKLDCARKTGLISGPC